MFPLDPRLFLAMRLHPRLEHQQKAVTSHSTSDFKNAEIRYFLPGWVKWKWLFSAAAVPSRVCLVWHRSGGRVHRLQPMLSDLHPPVNCFSSNHLPSLDSSDPASKRAQRRKSLFSTHAGSTVTYKVIRSTHTHVLPSPKMFCLHSATFSGIQRFHRDYLIIQHENGPCLLLHSPMNFAFRPEWQDTHSILKSLLRFLCERKSNTCKPVVLEGRLCESPMPSPPCQNESDHFQLAVSQNKRETTLVRSDFVSCDNAIKPWFWKWETVISNWGDCQPEIHFALYHMSLTLMMVLDQFILNITYERSYHWHLVLLMICLRAIKLSLPEKDRYREIYVPWRCLYLVPSFPSSPGIFPELIRMP